MTNGVKYLKQIGYVCPFWAKYLKYDKTKVQLGHDCRFSRQGNQGNI